MTDDGATVTELGAALRRGETSVVELTRESLRRIARRDSEVNAFALVDAVGALDAARGRTRRSPTVTTAARCTGSRSPSRI